MSTETPTGPSSAVSIATSPSSSPPERYLTTTVARINTSSTPSAAAPFPESGGPGKGTAALGVLLVLILGTVVVKYLSGDDEDGEVAIETADDRPVGVSVDTDEE